MAVTSTAPSLALVALAARAEPADHGLRMAKMKWTKPSADTLAYFERIAPGPPIEARRMFGMPARFLNGHMLVAVFGNTFMLHLSAEDREACLAAGAKPFAPMGREAKEYVDVAPGLFDDRTLKEWIVRGMRYLGSLPPKLKRKRANPAKATRSSAPPRSRAAPPTTTRTSTRGMKAKAALKAARPGTASGRNGAHAGARDGRPSTAKTGSTTKRAAAGTKRGATAKRAAAGTKRGAAAKRASAPERTPRRRKTSRRGG